MSSIRITKSKIKSSNSICSFIIITIMWLLSVFCYYNSDYESYRAIYEYYATNNISGIVNEGFLILCKIGLKVGLSFELFRGVYLTICFVLLYKNINYFGNSKRKKIVLSIFYLMYPFALDVVQMRFMFASLMTMYGVRYLEKNNKKDDLKFLACLFIAFTQHTSVIVYLLFFLCRINYEKLKIIPIVMIIEIVGILLIIPRFQTIIRLFASNINSIYSYSSYSIYLGVMYVLIAIYIVFVNYYFFKNMSGKEVSYTNKLLLITLLFAPLVMINENLARAYRGCSILIYAMTFKPASKRHVLNFYNFAVLIYLSVMVYIHLSPHNISHWNNVVLPLIKNSFLF